MIILTATTDKIQVITSAAATVDVHVSAMDFDGTTVTPQRTNTAITTAATTDIQAAPASSHQISVKTINIRNKHASTSTDVTVQFNQNATLFELYKTTLLAGNELSYVEGIGWFLYNTPALTPAVVQTITLTGAQNDIALTAGCSFLRCNNATLLSATGFSAGFDGQILEVVSVGAGNVSVAHQSGSSSAANRTINIATSGASFLGAGYGVMTFVYDGTSSRWRMIFLDQGAPIDVAYTAGDYTSDTGTWTVDSGDLIAYNYLLRGRMLTLVLGINNSTVTGTPARLQVLLPNGYTIGHTSQGVGGGAVDNSTIQTSPPGFLTNAAASTTKLLIYKPGFTGTWAASTNLTNFNGTHNTEIA